MNIILFILFLGVSTILVNLFADAMEVAGVFVLNMIAATAYMMYHWLVPEGRWIFTISSAAFLTYLASL